MTQPMNEAIRILTERRDHLRLVRTELHNDIAKWQRAIERANSDLLEAIRRLNEVERALGFYDTNLRLGQEENN